ncbi:hypothetical protein RhiJN_16542 [Ceratobasidium sp. AG-Ba]|nr:hypothetical protein RhiJN_16542 [Ceratobasidium sp. AG-Ba]
MVKKYSDQAIQTIPQIEPEPRPLLDSEDEPKPESFPFGQKSPSPESLSPSALRTKNLVELYFRNLKETKHVLFQSESLPTLPDDVWDDILADRYVDIERIHLAYNPPECSISSLRYWCMAFNTYVAGVCLAFPHRTEEFRIWVDNVTILLKSYDSSSHPLIFDTERMYRRIIFDSHSRTLDEQACLKEFNSKIRDCAKSQPSKLLDRIKPPHQDPKLAPMSPPRPAAASPPKPVAASSPKPVAASPSKSAPKPTPGKKVQKPIPTAPKSMIAEAPKAMAHGVKSERAGTDETSANSCFGICSRWNWTDCSLGELCRRKHVCFACQSDKHSVKDCDVSGRRRSRLPPKY